MNIFFKTKPKDKLEKQLENTNKHLRIILGLAHLFLFPEDFFGFLESVFCFCFFLVRTPHNKAFWFSKWVGHTPKAFVVLALKPKKH